MLNEIVVHTAVRRCCQLIYAIAGELPGLDYKPQILQEDTVNRAVRLMAGVLSRSYEVFTREKTLFARHVDMNFGYVVSQPTKRWINELRNSFKIRQHKYQILQWNMTLSQFQRTQNLAGHE
jgi:hypothetical protein